MRVSIRNGQLYSLSFLFSLLPFLSSLKLKRTDNILQQRQTKKINCYGSHNKSCQRVFLRDRSVREWRCGNGLQGCNSQVLWGRRGKWNSCEMGTLSSVESWQFSVKAPEDLCGRSPVFRHRCYPPGTSAAPDKSSFSCSLCLCNGAPAGGCALCSCWNSCPGAQRG